MPKTTPSGRLGTKHTVYLSADQEDAFVASGLTIGDVISRGLEVVPPSPDSILPEDLRQATLFFMRVATLLYHGGKVFTPYVADEVLEQLQNGDVKGLEEISRAVNSEAPAPAPRKRPARSKKGSGQVTPEQLPEGASGPVDEFLDHPETGTRRARPDRSNAE